MDTTNKIVTETSKQFSLNWQDLGKGLIVATLTPVFVILQQCISSGTDNINWKLVGMSAVGGLLAYLSKNFGTPAQTILQDKK